MALNSVVSSVSLELDMLFLTVPFSTSIEMSVILGHFVSVNKNALPHQVKTYLLTPPV